MWVNRACAAIAFAAAMVMFVSCGASVRGYVLSHRGDAEVLVPPGVTLPEQGKLEVKLLKARKVPFHQTGCDIEGGPISVQWRGRTALVRVESDSELLGLGTVNEGPVALDPRGRVNGRLIALDPLQFINKFRTDLIALEADGCLRGGEGSTLAASIAQRLPFQPFIAYLLRFGAFDLNEFIDLTPDFRLRVVYPVYSEDNYSDRSKIKGVETVYYAIVADQKDGRLRISPVANNYSLQHGGKAQESTKRPSPFPRSSAYFRLFLKKNRSSEDPITVAIVLRSTDRRHLDEGTQELDNSAEASCRAVTSSEVKCIDFPTLTGVNAEIRVEVNGQEAFARLGAQVSEVITDAGVSDAPRSVRVRRLFGKHLVPIKAESDNKDLLALVLMPGDSISYR
jgi:hypothetical protein